MGDRGENPSETGFTLIELIVYSALLLLVMSVVGGFFISGLETATAVRTMTNASTSGQIVADSVETNIRNASDFQLTVPGGTDQFLVARTAQRGSTLSWTCIAWYYSAAGSGSIRFKQSSTAILAPTASELSTWILLNEGIVPASGTSIFSSSGQRLTMTFKALAGDRPPVVITSSATSRAGASGSLACY
jgi:Tfp pilus assembly protein PilW